MKGRGFLVSGYQSSGLAKELLGAQLTCNTRQSLRMRSGDKECQTGKKMPGEWVKIASIML